MTSRHIFGALAAFLWTVEAVAAGSAPPQLRGKSVSIVWSESGSYKRASDGKQVSAVGQLTRTVYVSDSGRAFVRTSSGTIAGQSLPGMGTSGRSRDVGPEGTAGSVQFTGNSMAIFGANQGIARRIAATFDPAYSSCTATVTVGKSGPGSTIKGFDGQVYEVLSMQPGSISCSLRAGNAFAN